jgi:SAM-dependent methyltransferase
MKKNNIDHFYNDIYGWFSKTHAREFSNIISSLENNSVWVEVGSFKGKSLSFSVVESIIKNKKIKFYAVDTWSSDITGTQMSLDTDVINGNLYNVFLKNTEKIKDYFTPFKMTSIEASLKFEDASVDVVYIDAMHDYDSVTKDWKAWLPKLKKNGTLIFDDCVKDNTWGVWESVIDCSNFLKIDPIYKKPIAILKIPQ